jgi:hypothetical protein
MTLRTRKYVLTVIVVLAAAVYGQLAGGWNDVQYFSGAAGVLAVMLLIGLPWLEYAPDGAFRKQARSN